MRGKKERARNEDREEWAARSARKWSEKGRIEKERQGDFYRVKML